MEEKQRTISQNNALHKYCTDVSEALNSSGISYKMLLDGLEISNTMETTKNLFRLIAGVMYAKYSTSDLTTKELNNVFENFNEILARKGIHVHFPSQENMIEGLEK